MATIHKVRPDIITNPPSRIDSTTNQQVEVAAIPETPPNKESIPSMRYDPTLLQ